VNYYTRTHGASGPAVIKEHQSQTSGRSGESREVEVQNQRHRYRKKAQLTEEIIGEEPLDLLLQIFNTVSLWFDLPPDAVSAIARTGLDSPEAFTRRTRRYFHPPLFALCDPTISVVSRPPFTRHRAGPDIYL